MDTIRSSVAAEIAEIRANLGATIAQCDGKAAGFRVGSLAELEQEFLKATSADSPGQNATVVAALTDVREELSQCVQVLRKISRWITLLVPAIEDGNNFGVGVQGEVLKVVLERSNHLNGLFAALPGYYKDRAAAWKELGSAKGSQSATTSNKEETGPDDDGKQKTKTTVTIENKTTAGQAAANHPDGLSHVVALDVQTYFHLYHTLLIVRDSYVVVGDTIEKNLSKIEAPKGQGGCGRGGGGMSMY